MLERGVFIFACSSVSSRLLAFIIPFGVLSSCHAVCSFALTCFCSCCSVSWRSILAHLRDALHVIVPSVGFLAYEMHLCPCVCDFKVLYVFVLLRSFLLRFCVLCVLRQVFMCACCDIRFGLSIAFDLRNTWKQLFGVRRRFSER